MGMKYTIHTLTHTVTDVEVYDKVSSSYKPIEAGCKYSIAINDYYKSGGYYGLLANCKLIEISYLYHNSHPHKFVRVGKFC